MRSRLLATPDELMKRLAAMTLSSVLQECRAFDDADFVKNHPKRCCQLLTKLLYLLSKGERFTGEEASSVFFRVTKLFQSPDVRPQPQGAQFIASCANFTFLLVLGSGQLA